MTSSPTAAWKPGRPTRPRAARDGFPAGSPQPSTMPLHRYWLAIPGTSKHHKAPSLRACAGRDGYATATYGFPAPTPTEPPMKTARGRTSPGATTRSVKASGTTSPIGLSGFSNNSRCPTTESIIEAHDRAAQGWHMCDPALGSKECVERAALSIRGPRQYTGSRRSGPAAPRHLGPHRANRDIAR